MSFFQKILFIKLLSCLFAVLVFSRFVQLGDAERYINADIILSVSAFLNRTYFTDNFFATLALITGKGIGIHLATSILVSISIWYAFKDYTKHLSNFFWLLLVLPFSAIWTSVVGKEALSTIAFMLIIKWIAEAVILGRSNGWLLIVGIILGGIVRPNYAIPYFFLVVIVYLFLYGRRKICLSSGTYFSAGVHVLTVFACFIISVIALIASIDLWKSSLVNVMEISASYFLSYDGGSNRLGIEWASVSDFFYNMYWGIPASIVGPTFNEAVNKPILFPFFVEGIIAILLMPYLFYKLFLLSFENYRIRFFFYIAFIPAALIALLTHYPLGLFNPGSAMRYKQSLVPLLYFLPVLVMAISRSLSKRPQNALDNTQHI